MSTADYLGLPVGWGDAIQPYLGSTTLYNCPSGPNGGVWANPSKSGYTDYWFNANLSSVHKKALKSPAATLLLGEGSDGIDVTDATYSKTSLSPG